MTMYNTFKLVSALTICSALLCCKHSRSQEVKFEKMAFVGSLPVVISSDSVLDMKDSVLIYSLDEYVLFKLPNNIEYSTIRTKPGNGTLETSTIGKVDSTKIEYYYFVYKRGKANGLLMNHPKSPLSIDTISVQKMREDYFFAGSDIYEGIKDFTLLAEHWNSPKDSLVQIYIPRTEREDGDTVMLYLTKNNSDIDLSFSKKPDSITGLRLYRVIGIANKKKSLVSGSMLPRRVLYYELKPIEYQKDDDKILAMIKKIRMW